MSSQSDTATSTIAPRRPIDTRELSRHAAHLGRDYRAHTGSGQADMALEGDFGVDVLPGGLLLRHAHVHSARAMHCSARLSPGIKIVLLLEGKVDVRFGGQALPDDAEAQGHGIVVNLAEAADFERRARAGTVEKSLTLTLPHDWLEQRVADLCGPAAGPACRLPHLAMASWRPDPGLRTLAHTLFRPQAATSHPARLLHCESLALAMIAAAWPALTDARTDAPPAAIDNRRLRRMRDLTEGGHLEHMTLAEIARETGMSRASLQRHFRHCYNMSVQHYLRRRRLQRARRALRDAGCSVAGAAELAGYTSPANFATAFRREFGTTPSTDRASASR